MLVWLSTPPIQRTELRAAVDRHRVSHVVCRMQTPQATQRRRTLAIFTLRSARGTGKTRWTAVQP
jgi:hypothetical protein